jgi:hypothetical protein
MCARQGSEQARVSIGTTLLSVLVVLLRGIVPARPHSANLSYYQPRGWLFLPVIFGVMLLERPV